MKILILSNTPWDNNNSFGNTFTNLFEGIDDIEIANIYCRYGLPNNSVASHYYQITEKSLIKNLRNPKVAAGQVVYATKCVDTELLENEQKVFDYARKKRLQIFFWGRDLIWKIGRWNSPEFRKFVDDFAPDLLYMPVYNSNYLLNIALFLKEHTSAKMIAHISDDNYTLRQFSLSPFYWLDRFIKRKKIRRLVKQAEFVHVISDIQKLEYEEAFGKECRVFKKSLNFDKSIRNSHDPHQPLKLVYTGNIGGGRWESLACVGKVLKELNQDTILAELYIYSFTPLSQKMKESLSIEGSVHFMGGIPSCEVKKVQEDADVLLHVESLKLKERLKVHQSFSTKLVDYMHTGNCIFAVGTKDMASIDYLLKQDAAIVATSHEEIKRKLRALIENPQMILEYGDKAWNSGKENHQKEKVSLEFERDLKGL